MPLSMHFLPHARAQALLDVVASSARMEYIGEPISQLAHALQAAYFATRAGYSDDVVIACLLHDIGHFCWAAQPTTNGQAGEFAGELLGTPRGVSAGTLTGKSTLEPTANRYRAPTPPPQMDGLGTLNHECIGMQFVLQYGVPQKIARLIGAHVDAKRYLAGKNPSYYAKLSPASKGTLAFQGGPMSEAEQVAFRKQPLFSECIQLRMCDEKAKQIGLCVPGLDAYYPALVRCLG